MIKEENSFQKKVLTWNGEPVENSNFEEFKDRQFARNFLMNGGDLKKAFELTFGQAGSIKEMDTMLAKPLVQREIDALLPSDKEIAKVLKSALNARTPDFIRWGEKHQFVDTVLKLKGHLKKEDESSKNTTNNIVMVIEK